MQLSDPYKGEAEEDSIWEYGHLVEKVDGTDVTSPHQTNGKRAQPSAAYDALAQRKTAWTSGWQAAPAKMKHSPAN